MFHNLKRDFSKTLKQQIKEGTSKGWTYIGVFGRGENAILKFISESQFDSFRIWSAACSVRFRDADLFQFEYVLFFLEYNYKKQRFIYNSFRHPFRRSAGFNALRRFSCKGCHGLIAIQINMVYSKPVQIRLLALYIRLFRLYIN